MTSRSPDFLQPAPSRPRSRGTFALFSGKLLLVLGLIVSPFLWLRRPLNAKERRLVGTWRDGSRAIVFRLDRVFEIRPYLFGDLKDQTLSLEGAWHCSGSKIFLSTAADRSKWERENDVFDGKGEGTAIVFGSDDTVQFSSLSLRRPPIE